MNIPMLDLKREYLYMKNDIDAAITRCLEHQSWIFGPEVKEFEKRCADFLGIKNCIGCSSGTDALVIALRAIAISSGKEFFTCDDEILTTPFTFTATGDAILRSGATPVFIDIDPANFNISIDGIVKYLKSSGEKVKAILLVHLYGTPCDMETIVNIASSYHTFVVEDVAQAFGACWKNKKLGTSSHAGAFSFFPSKNLGGFGDSGMISTNNDNLAEIMRTLIKHGGKDKYNVDHVGYNARLDTLQAAVLLAKIKYVDEFNRKRIEIAKRYNEQLYEVKEIILPEIIEGSVFHQYTIRVKDNRRTQLQDFLKQRGIATMVYYPFCLHHMKVFQGRSKIFGHLAEAEKASKEVLSIPIEPLMTEQEQSYVVSNIKNFFLPNE